MNRKMEEEDTSGNLSISLLLSVTYAYIVLCFSGFKSAASTNSATFATLMAVAGGTSLEHRPAGRQSRVTGAALAVADPLVGQNHTPLQLLRFRCAPARNPANFY